MAEVGRTELASQVVVGLAAGVASGYADVSVLELDRVLDASPGELDSHRPGLTAARQNRLELIGRSTARLLTQMDETVRKANYTEAVEDEH